MGVSTHHDGLNSVDYILVSGVRIPRMLIRKFSIYQLHSSSVYAPPFHFVPTLHVCSYSATLIMLAASVNQPCSTSWPPTLFSLSSSRGMVRYLSVFFLRLVIYVLFSMLSVFLQLPTTIILAYADLNYAYTSLSMPFPLTQSHTHTRACTQPLPPSLL